MANRGRKRAAEAECDDNSVAPKSSKRLTARQKKERQKRLRVAQKVACGEQKPHCILAGLDNCKSAQQDYTGRFILGLPALLDKLDIQSKTMLSEASPYALCDVLTSTTEHQNVYEFYQPEFYSGQDWVSLIMPVPAAVPRPESRGFVHVRPPSAVGGVPGADTITSGWKCLTLMYVQVKLATVYLPDDSEECTWQQEELFDFDLMMSESFYQESEFMQSEFEKGKDEFLAREGKDWCLVNESVSADSFPREVDYIIPKTLPGQALDQAVMDRLREIASNYDVSESPVVYELKEGPRVAIALHVWCPPQVRVSQLLSLLEDDESFRIPGHSRDCNPHRVVHHHLTMYSFRGDDVDVPERDDPFVYASSTQHRMARFMLRFPVPEDVKRHLETLRPKLMRAR